MTPATYNITIYRGGTFNIECTSYDEVGFINFEELYDSALMYVQPAWLNIDDPIPTEPLLILSTDNNRILFNGTELTLHLASSETRELSFSSGVYNLKLISNGAEVIEDIFLEGEVTIKWSPTP